MTRIAPALALAITILTGCADVPALDDAISPTARNADFPSLLPIDALLGGTSEVQITQTSTANLQTRIARLRARAARLQRPVIDRQTRRRLRRAISRHS